jgi:hypothetical protein
MRTPPRTTDNEVWYVVPGKPARPRVVMPSRRGTATTSPGGKGREAVRGSRTEVTPTDKGNRRRREGHGEGPDGPLAHEIAPQQLPEG